MEIDYEKLRSALLDYFGTGSVVTPVLMAYLGKITNASNNELLKIAIENNFNLENFYFREKEKRI